MKNFFMLLIIIIAIIIMGCDGSDTRESINDALHTLSGAEEVKRGERIKEQLNQISEKEAQRARSGLEEKNPGAQPGQPNQ